MSFHRFVILSLTILFTVVPFGNLPVRAQEGELAAQDAQSQVNLRAEANTQSEIVAMGKVGDRVQILSTITTKDGQTWHRIKVLQSGIVGWVRGDLIKVLSASKTATPHKSVAKGSAKVASKKSVSAPLKPPKTVAKSSTPPPSKSTVVQHKVVENPAPPGAQAIANSSVAIVAFKTPNYAVRVFSEAGQLRMNLYNRKSQQVVLEAVPVESKNSGKTTTYSYSSDLKVTVVVPANGTPTLTTVALGNTLEEGPETSPPSSAVTDTAPNKTPDQTTTPIQK
jgi:Bacterial SH3 domain